MRAERTMLTKAELKAKEARFVTLMAVSAVVRQLLTEGPVVESVTITDNRGGTGEFIVTWREGK